MTRRPIAPLFVRAVATALAVAGPALAAAQPSPRDSLRLDALQAEAVRRDPRGGQVELLARQAALRLRSLDAERLPTLGVNAQGQYQTDVVTLPIRLPGGAPPTPPHDTYDANLAVRQRLYDPTRGPRRDVERARLAESQAGVRASLFALRQQVSDAYFGALRLQAQRAEVGTGITDLEAQLRLARERVRERAALASESATLEAELLRRRQSLAELDAGRDAALTVLADLTGRPMEGTDALALPELGAAVARARAAAVDTLRARPEYERFARSRDALARQQATVAAQDRPRVLAFGRAGYGRPGLNPLGREFDEYAVAGVQLEWTPWSWGTTRREREALAVQQQLVATEEAAFTAAVRRGVATDLATIDRLERALADDDAIVALRERILGETRLRFGEGVVSSAEYVDRETDLLAARLARASHRVELAQARARFLTSLGLEVR